MKFSKLFNPNILLVLALFFSSSPANAVQKQSVLVREVLTGDSFRMEGGQTVKYIGLESPPLQSRIPLLRKYGSDALDFNRNLVNGKKVLLEWDSQVRDDQRNLLAYVFLEDGALVNREVLRTGNAKLSIVEPNHRYSGTLRQAELEARRQRRGLWKEEPKNPYLKSEYIGDKNTKIFYFPNSSELERVPEVSWIKFRSRVEAKAAGYRACSACREDQRTLY